MRAFFAIDIPVEIKDKISGFISGCRKIQRDYIKYVEDENLHITLKFLGETDQAAVDSIINDLKKIKTVKPSLSIKTSGAFPNIIFPKVAWVGVEENTGLKELYENIELTASQYGFPIEEREFHPHITIARIKGRIQNDWTQFFKRSNAEEFGRFSPENYALYKSELTKNGPVYSKIAEFPFQEENDGK